MQLKVQIVEARMSQIRDILSRERPFIQQGLKTVHIARAGVQLCQVSPETAKATRVSISDFQLKRRRFLDRAVTGEPIVLTCYGRDSMELRRIE